MIMSMRMRSAILLTAGCWTVASAQEVPPRDFRAAMQDSVALQNQGVSAMQESIAKQRAGLQTQARPKEPNAFFVLSPPAPLVSTGPADANEADCAALPRPRLDELIANAAMREGLDEDLLRSVMHQESAFHPCAVSPKGAMGLMQLMPDTAAQLNVRNPFDPEENVAGGARLLKQLLTRYNGDRRLALGAYNAGPSAVDAAGGVPPIRETIEYIHRILSLLPIRP
jgi:soluble lytic murein transglycosylase-like protein